MTYEIVPATVDHAFELSRTMRLEDREEAWALDHLTPWEAIQVSVGHSGNIYSGLVDGQVLCMFGVGKRTLLSEIGFPWMLSSTLVPKHVRAWMRGSQIAFKQMQSEAKVLENYVDARYTAAVRWLKWLGFTIHPAEPFGVDKLPFHKFTWEQ